jgi:hypothetical protein
MKDKSLVIALLLLSSGAAAVSNSTATSRNLRPSAPSKTTTDEGDAGLAAVRKLEGVDNLAVQRYQAVPPGERKHPYYYSESYLPRGTPHLTDEERAQLTKEWGSWTLVDSKASSRPKNDFYMQFLNRDVPRDKFPSTAWQVDKDYLSKFLPESIALLERSMEAILSEYGLGKKDMPDKSFEERSVKFKPPMNEASFKGLKRRLMHAVMSQDRFTVAMAGHSAAAGMLYTK